MNWINFKLMRSHILMYSSLRYLSFIVILKLLFCSLSLHWFIFPGHCVFSLYLRFLLILILSLALLSLMVARARGFVLDGHFATNVIPFNSFKLLSFNEAFDWFDLIHSFADYLLLVQCNYGLFKTCF